jgi:hypothetical protein
MLISPHAVAQARIRLLIVVLYHTRGRPSQTYHKNQWHAQLLVLPAATKRASFMVALIFPRSFSVNLEGRMLATVRHWRTPPLWRMPQARRR